MAATYNKDKTNAIMSLFDNKENLVFFRNDEEVRGALPKINFKR